MGSSHNVDAWVMELEWLCCVVCGKSTRRKMWRVIQCASIYFFWQERNCRLHGGSFRTTSMILHHIFSTIQARALSWSEDVSEFFQVFFFVCCLAWPRAVRFFFFFFHFFVWPFLVWMLWLAPLEVVYLFCWLYFWDLLCGLVLSSLLQRFFV